MIYKITHTSTYDYTNPVSLSHHLLKLKPRSLCFQRCISHNLQINPSAAVTEEHLDYFGNDVTFLTMEGAHQQLLISATSQVDVFLRRMPVPAETLGWE